MSSKVIVSLRSPYRQPQGHIYTTIMIKVERTNGHFTVLIWDKIKKTVTQIPHLIGFYALALIEGLQKRGLKIHRNSAEGYLGLLLSVN